LRERVGPGTIALASVTPCTEDPASPKNRFLAKMNDRVVSLAKEFGALAIPTGRSMWDVLERGRRQRRDFHVTYDFVHPNEAGHIAVAVAMLRSLGAPEAAEWLEKGRLARVFVAATARQASDATPPPEPPPWLVTAKLIQSAWDGNTFLAGKARTPIDAAIESGRDFTKAIDVGGGQVLTWQRYVPSVDYTGLNASGSVDFAALTQAAVFEGGYGARRIHSNRKRPVALVLGSRVFAGTIHLITWLNGKEVYRGLITAAPKKRVTVQAQLDEGWNTLVFKANHRTWQWQVSVDIQPVGEDVLDDLSYSIDFARDGGSSD